MFAGTALALLAGLLWGLVFIVPVLLPDYLPAMLSAGRYLAFGLIALPLAWIDRVRLSQLGRSDWLEAGRLALVGNLLYYTCLAAAIQRAGAPLPTMIIGSLPVVIAVVANLRVAHGVSLPWSRLLPSLVLIAAGIALVNQVELDRQAGQPTADVGRYAVGAVLAAGALVCWTWYPIRNAQWLRAHPDRSARAWATAQGLMTLPLAAAAYVAMAAWYGFAGSSLEMPFGPRPRVFVSAMLLLGLLASWLGTLAWNEASQRLPTALAGQLIVFETLAALGYAYLLRGSWPSWIALAGIALLIAGVAWALKVFGQAQAGVRKV
jgi:drug/metabolite transporter (DMT)-like permease